MLEISQQLESTAIQLQEHLRFNHTSLRSAVEHLLVEVEQAQKYLYNEGPTIVVKVSNINLVYLMLKHFKNFSSYFYKV